MKVDLHIHSTYSDSSRSPEEIVALEKERNVSLISICDHATIGAYDTLPQICSENNIKYVLGVEFCHKNDMRITGGCDCHGAFDKSEGFTIGALDIYSPMLDLKGII